tara:strand:- start:269 stop:604 length:336 start_codon:yes stop_codon:yes gene_type:complete
MADLHGMTLQERMNTINGDAPNSHTFCEALNKRLKTMGTHNSVNYSGISLKKYSIDEVLNIIYKNADIRSMNCREILNLMVSGNSDKGKYTEQEALNQIENLTNFNNGIPS